MSTVRWYFDFISPFAWLQWHTLYRLHRAGELQLQLQPQPILFAAVLDHLGQRGPAEIPGKRAFTYRLVQWQAHSSGVPLQFPPAHPFNPIAALRLALAAELDLQVIDAIFQLIWAQGRLPDPPALQELATQRGLGELDALIGSPQVKAQLRSNTETAIARGVFGVPSAELDGELYWGNDATPMLLHALAHPQCWSQAPYARLADLPVASSRSS